MSDRSNVVQMRRRLHLPVSPLDFTPSANRPDYFTRHGINPGRILTTKDRNRVRSRFMAWASKASPQGQSPQRLPTPDFTELRWDDDFTVLYVAKPSGLMEFGFRSMFREHLPIDEDQNWAIFDRENPAARAMLNAIREVTAAPEV